MITYFVAALCVVGLAIGQVLFKLSASALTKNGTFVNLQFLSLLTTAICLYGITSIAWVWVLQRTDLGRVYPLMAMAFVLVPLGSHIFLGERFHAQYFVGVAMIMAGIVVSIRA